MITKIVGSIFGGGNNTKAFAPTTTNTSVQSNTPIAQNGNTVISARARNISGPELTPFDHEDLLALRKMYGEAKVRSIKANRNAKIKARNLSRAISIQQQAYEDFKKKESNAKSKSKAYKNSAKIAANARVAAAHRELEQAAKASRDADDFKKTIESSNNVNVKKFLNKNTEYKNFVSEILPVNKQTQVKQNNIVPPKPVPVAQVVPVANPKRFNSTKKKYLKSMLQGLKSTLNSTEKSINQKNMEINKIFNTGNVINAGFYPRGNTQKNRSDLSSRIAKLNLNIMNMENSISKLKMKRNEEKKARNLFAQGTQNRASANNKVRAVQEKIDEAKKNKMKLKTEHIDLKKIMRNRYKQQTHQRD